MNYVQKRMAMIFDEWAARYAANPEEFDEIVDGNGAVVDDYGYRCTLFFEKIACELESSGTFPTYEDFLKNPELDYPVKGEIE